MQLPRAKSVARDDSTHRVSNAQCVHRRHDSCRPHRRVRFPRRLSIAGRSPAWITDLVRALLVRNGRGGAGSTYDLLIAELRDEGSIGRWRRFTPTRRGAGLELILDLADEADPGGLHLRSRPLHVVDQEPDDRRRSEELVELVRGTVEVDLRAVVEAESRRLSIFGVRPTERPRIGFFPRSDDRPAEKSCATPGISRPERRF
jgi:hypothetical protein